jgi:exopolysaccharide biosynthesis polyprenyl glycosylphosphotransferase
MGVYAFINFFFSKIFGAYRVGYLKVSDVLLSQVLAVLCCNAVTYMQLALIGRWRFTAYLKPIIQMTVYDVIAVVIWVIFMRWVYAKIYPPRQLLLIYGDISPKALIKKMKSREDKYSIVDTIHISEGMDNVVEKISQHEAVMIGDIPAVYRNKLLKYCYQKSIRCYSIPKISDIMIKSSATINLFDTELLLFRNRGLTAEQKILKRASDIAFSLIILIIFSPILLFVALVIKLYDGGPVLYKQDRLTLNGAVFKIYKFRSMRVDSEKDGAQLAKKYDDRITPIGHVIRALHIDELPQLFNILKGEMAFVGPRPERPEIAEEYKKSIPEFDFRLKMKAGLTGYAQVFGKYSTTPLDKLKLDLTYIENYSFPLDLMIIIQTVKILFQKENSEGLEAGQKTALRTEDKNK